MLVVYLTGYIIEGMDRGWWYFFSASFSLLLVCALVRVSLSDTIFAVVILETLAMIVVLVSWGFYAYGVDYVIHEFLIETISIIQVVFMITGNPRFDFNSRVFKQLGMADILLRLYHYRNKKHRHLYNKKT